MIEKLTRSLSFRLLAIFLVLATAFVYFATIGIRWVYSEDDLRDLISGHLSLHVNYVRNDIGDPPRIDRAIAITKQVPVDIRIVGEGIDWASDERFPKLDELHFGASDIFSEDPGALLDKLDDVEFAVLGNHRFLKIDQGKFQIIVSSPRIGDDSADPPLLRTILAIGLVWLFVAYLCVRWLFKPIAAIRDGASRIGSGDFSHRITAYRNDQLGDLAKDVNSLAADVGRMLDAKRQLLLGISHELRSPLSRMRLATELVRDDERKELLKTEVAEMERIIATLLEAERLNTRHAALNRSPTRIAELFEQVTGDYFERERRRIRVQIDDESLEANIDAVRLVLIIKNLLGNALRYSTGEDGSIVLGAARDDGNLVISVADRGPGLSEEQLDNLGEPFYRGDPSRTRQTGGTGLGLYLAKLATEAHGGTLTVDRRYTHGARIVATIPG